MAHCGSSIFTVYCFALLLVNPHQVLLSQSQSTSIMNPARRIIPEELCCLLVTLLTMGTQSLPVPTDIPVCTASETAHYQLTFTGKWSRSAFPKQYPVYRPPAQWSNIVGKSSARWFHCGVIGRVVRQVFGGFWVPQVQSAVMNTHTLNAPNERRQKKSLHDINLGVGSVHVLTSQVLISRTVSKRRKGWTNFSPREFTEGFNSLTLSFYLEANVICTLHYIIYRGLYFNFDNQMCWLITRLLPANTCCNKIFSLPSRA